MPPLILAGLFFALFAVMAKLLPRYYEAHKPVPELWPGETVVLTAPVAWRLEGDLRERTGWGFLTDMRLIWVPMYMQPFTRYWSFFHMYAHGSLPKEPIELRRTHISNPQRLEDRRALEFESEGRPIILFFWSDRGREARETWYEHLASTAGRQRDYSTQG
jgi:hypothetical protein